MIALLVSIACACAFICFACAAQHILRKEDTGRHAPSYFDQQGEWYAAVTEPGELEPLPCFDEPDPVTEYFYAPADPDAVDKLAAEFAEACKRPPIWLPDHEDDDLPPLARAGVWEPHVLAMLRPPADGPWPLPDDTVTDLQPVPAPLPDAVHVALGAESVDDALRQIFGGEH